MNDALHVLRCSARRWITPIAMLASALLAGCATPPPSDVPVATNGGHLAPASSRQGYFFVGGQYATTKAGEFMSGQMYVEYRIPATVRFPYALVMIHGGGQTATNYLGTPDGRPGWADHFVAQGYRVYVVDQPARGRAAHHADIVGPASIRSPARRVEQLFTATAEHALWPQSHLHSQWPGDGAGRGKAGDPVFDQFYASQVPWSGHVRSEEMVRAAGAALLDRIGPAVLMTHSQSGPYGWQIADARPRLVRGIVTIEPNGPPFSDIDFVGAPEFFKPVRAAREYGLTWTPITFSPPVASASELTVVRQPEPEWSGAIRCWLQDAAAPRRLSTLVGIPVAVITGEASFRAGVDHCTARFLAQAGVANTHVRLQEHGIRGNGHMMMLEKNSLEIARVIQQWIERSVR